MNRRNVLAALGGASVYASLAGGTLFATRAAGAEIQKLDKTDAEWRRILPADRYAVLFEEATEPPHSSPLNDEHRPGTYLCAACNLPVFESADKYDSGTGWPSFTKPVAGALATKTDFKLIWPRTEYHCARCGGHQGHVFDDGPRPRGERWCNNGLALTFVPASQALPELIT